MNYRLAIFDFDGTLADTFAWFSQTINRLAEKYHFKSVTPAEIQTLRGESATAILRHVGVPRWKVPFIARDMRGLLTKEIDRVRLFPGVEEMLEKLSAAGIRLAVVSSNSRENIVRMLGPGNSSRIDWYECRASVFGKSARLERALARCQEAANASIYIGDELRDGEAARKVGIDFGAVAWGYCTPEALRRLQPAALFRSVDEIGARLCGEAPTEADVEPALRTNI